MPDRPLDRIVRELGMPDLADKLGALQPSDLQSLLLDVYIMFQTLRILLTAKGT